MARYGLFIDLSRCIGCCSCVVACKNYHGIPAGEDGRIKILDRITGEYPEVERWTFPLMCMQCEYPPCVSVCRYNASHKTDNGIITVDHDKCIGCELCTLACPYGVRVMRGEENVADSCDLCLDRVIAGEDPYCVQACPTGAMVFGDLDDPESEVSRSIRRENASPIMEKYRTKPKILYANMNKRDLLEKGIGGHPFGNNQSTCPQHL
ncbi:MAG: 4Fe-4S dicluster domain-containing protein [Deltaproteobacteria bacterium]|nr:4Fe-4S dicluster domain-containing protein [Deltaproteobacteria bacterium]